MLNYMRADFYRISHRLVRWILFALMTIGLVLMHWPSKGEQPTYPELLSGIESLVSFIPVLYGTLEMIFVFGDDFKGKTSQIAIGLGVSRLKVILSKWLVFTLTCFFDLVVFSLAMWLGSNLMYQSKIPAGLLPELFAHVLIATIGVAAYSASLLWILFLAQNITVALLFYVALSTTLVNFGITMLADQEWIQRFHISSYTLSNSLNVFRSRMVLGSFHFMSLLGILIYIAIGLGAAYLAYRHKELEF